MENHLIAILILICILLVIYVSRSEHFTNGSRRVTLHYVDWCPHCRTMKPIWFTVKNQTKNTGIVFKEVNEEITKTPGITSYPTILMITENGSTVQYNGPSDVNRLRNWITSVNTN